MSATEPPWEFRWHGPEDINLDEGEIWTSVTGYRWRRVSDGGWEVSPPPVKIVAEEVSDP